MVSGGINWDGDSTGDSNISESSLEGRGVVMATALVVLRDEATAGVNTWGRCLQTEATKND